MRIVIRDKVAARLGLGLAFVVLLVLCYFAGRGLGLISAGRPQSEIELYKEQIQKALSVTTRPSSQIPYTPTLTTTERRLVVPTLTGKVVDQANFLGNGEAARVESAILELERATGGQMAVLTVPTLGGDTLESFSIRVALDWKLGRNQDKGALLVLVRDSHDIRLEIGRGWEGAVNDASASDIIRDVGPFFRAGHFGDGLIYAVQQVQKNVTMKGQPRPGADR